MIADPLGYYFNNTCKSRALIASAVEAQVPHFIFSSITVRLGLRRDGDPAAIVAKADRISKVLGWAPRLNDLDTIVGHALGWEKRLIECRAASS